MTKIELSTEDAKCILDGIWSLDSEGLCSYELYYLGIRLLKAYFPEEEPPWWVKEEDWK